MPEPSTDGEWSTEPALDEPPGTLDERLSASKQPGMQALVRGLAMLDLIASLSTPARFADLVRLSGVAKGTVHRLLQTLIDARYLRLDPRDQTYRLGSRPFQLAHRVWDQFDLRGAAEPELLRLRDLTGETARLGVLEDDEVLYVDQREAAQPIRIASGVGGRAALHASALGKAIAAHLGPLDRHRMIDARDQHPFTERTIVTSVELERELNLIKARGYAVSVGETHEGINAVAAPVLDHRASPIGAVAVLAPAFRFGEERLHALGREVIESARRISGNIGELAMSISIQPRPQRTPSEAVRVAIPGDDFLGEGPHWSVASQRLHWVDILAPAFVTGDPLTGERDTLAMPELVGVVVPRAAGGFLAATESGIKTFDTRGEVRPLASPESDRPGNRFNDGKCDTRGRFWVGSLAINTAPGHGALWRLDPDGSVHLMADGFHISNGMGWSPDDTRFYFTDSGARVIHEYDFDVDSGAIENPRVFARVDESAGVPDGLAVDADGFVWSAQWDGWSVVRYDPDGRVDRVVTLPVPRPTSCAFGGPTLQTLFVTSARIRLSGTQLAEAPLSGSLFAVDAGVRGLPETMWGG